MDRNAMLGAVLAAVLAVSGCSDPPEVVRARQEAHDAQNQRALENPHVVGTMPDGRIVYRTALQYCSECTSPKTHWIYFTGGAVTSNWDELHGKVMVTHTAAMLNIQPDMTVDQVLELAQRAKKEQEDIDRAKWEELNKRFGNRGQ